MIPLTGNLIEVLPDFCDWLGIEFEEALAAIADSVYDACVLQNPQMLGDRLPRDSGALGKLRD